MGLDIRDKVMFRLFIMNGSQWSVDTQIAAQTCVCV